MFFVDQFTSRKPNVKQHPYVAVLQSPELHSTIHILTVEKSNSLSCSRTTRQLMSTTVVTFRNKGSFIAYIQCRTLFLTVLFGAIIYRCKLQGLYSPLPHTISVRETVSFLEKSTWKVYIRLPYIASTTEYRMGFKIVPNFNAFSSFLFSIKTHTYIYH